MTARIAYFNGHYVDAASIRIDPTDPGFMWGATVTDRVRTYRGEPFRLAEHLARFRRSAELCRIPLAASDAELAAIVRRLIPPGSDVVVVMFATPHTLCLHAEPIAVQRYRPLLERGARLVIPPTRQLPADCVPPQAKMRSRMHWWIAEQQAKEIAPEASALLLDHDGCITETAAANFLIVREGEVLSPPRARILHGVSLQVVEELCRQLGVPFREHLLTPADCEHADEALLTSTPYGVAGVVSLNGRPISWPGPMLRRLLNAWTELLGTSPQDGILPPLP